MPAARAVIGRGGVVDRRRSGSATAAGKGYVLGGTGDHRFWSWGKAACVAGSAEEIAAARPPSASVPLAVGDGARGPAA